MVVGVVLGPEGLLHRLLAELAHALLGVVERLGAEVDGLVGGDGEGGLGRDRGLPGLDNRPVLSASGGPVAGARVL